ncbi:MAG: hypothetical protein U0174_07835 [Polyangiaceae bacterium]
MTELSFVSAELKRFEETRADLLCLFIDPEVAPLTSVADMVDFRLAGRLSRARISGFLEGTQGARYLTPGRPALPFDRIVVLGQGAVREEGDSAYLDQVLSIVADLRSERTIVELPRSTLTPQARGEALAAYFLSKEIPPLWFVEPPSEQAELSLGFREHWQKTRRP